MYENKTPEALKAEALNSINQSSGLSSMAGGFADGVVGPIMEEVSNCYMALDAVPSMLFVDESSGAYIDLFAKQHFNITRRAGTRAYCNIAFTGTAGLVIPQGATFLTADGFSYTLVSEVILDETGAGTGRLKAAEDGSAYNVDAGAISRIYVTRAGLTSFLNEAADGGTDPESDAALLARVYERVKRPPTSGNGYQYRQWALEIAGVGNAKVVGLSNGPGTLSITLVDSNNRAPAATIVNAVVTHVDSLRPIGTQVTIAAAAELPIAITAQITLATAHDMAAVLEEFQEAMGAHLHSLIEAKFTPIYYTPDDDLSYSLLYNRVLAILLNVAGVENFSELTINGGTADIAITADQIPVLGEVSLS